jgi:GDP-L-fucose synthase
MAVAGYRYSESLSWGKFMYVDDLASACVFLMKNYSEEQFINIGTGLDVTIREAVELVRETIGYQGEVVWDSTKPDGTPRKLRDISRIKTLGWEPTIALRDGIVRFYEWLLDNYVPQTMASVR